ncbi:unnamed protein product [Mytilus edulis]|uniref:DZIP3-like HEPN domain-containing protein n=1 Tax=Mytilus edulis TaxID=6550 RepID=A0A8S3QUG9_MYTED|nr:unnamed protein product [Mytilus edulis]
MSIQTRTSARTKSKPQPYTPAKYENFSINKTRALDKKLEACNRAMDIKIEQKHQNYILELSAAAYEVLKGEIDIYFEQHSTYKLLPKHQHDNQGLCIRTSHSVRNRSNNRQLYRINLFHTTSKVEVNGQGSPSSSLFDTTLMIILLQQLTSIQVSDMLPFEKDDSVGAHLGRIRYYRNLTVHSTTNKLTKYISIKRAIQKLMKPGSLEEEMRHVREMDIVQLNNDVKFEISNSLKEVNRLEIIICCVTGFLKHMEDILSDKVQLISKHTLLEEKMRFFNRECFTIGEKQRFMFINPRADEKSFTVPIDSELCYVDTAPLWDELGKYVILIPTENEQNYYIRMLDDWYEGYADYVVSSYNFITDHFSLF